MDVFTKNEYSLAFKTARDNHNIKQNKIDKCSSKIDNLDNYESLKTGNNNLTLLGLQ